MIKRNTQFNIMSVVSMIAFSILVIAYGSLTATAQFSGEWRVGIGYVVFSQWAVPLLIMTIGYCYLSADYDFSLEALSVVCYLRRKSTLNRVDCFRIKKQSQGIKTGIILRCVAACGFWWVLSSLLYMSVAHKGEYDFDTLLECMAKILKMPYFIAFYQLIVMLFVFYPLLKRIANSKKLTIYAVIIFFALSVLNKIIVFIPFGNYIYMFTSQINWNNFTVYGFYLFLGVLLSRLNLKWYIRIVLYSVFFIAASGMYCLYIFKSLGKVDNSLFNELVLIFAFVQACSFYVFVKEVSKKLSNSLSLNAFLKRLSENAFVYIAVFVILYIEFNDSLKNISIPFGLGIAFESVVLIVLSMTICIILRNIPFFKYLTT